MRYRLVSRMWSAGPMVIRERPNSEHERIVFRPRVDALSTKPGKRQRLSDDKKGPVALARMRCTCELFYGFVLRVQISSGKWIIIGKSSMIRDTPATLIARNPHLFAVQESAGRADIVFHFRGADAGSD